LTEIAGENRMWTDPVFWLAMAVHAHVAIWVVVLVRWLRAAAE